jgi:hypothetical protein
MTEILKRGFPGIKVRRQGRRGFGRAVLAAEAPAAAAAQPRSSLDGFVVSFGGQAVSAAQRGAGRGARLDPSSGREKKRPAHARGHLLTSSRAPHTWIGTCGTFCAHGGHGLCPAWPSRRARCFSCLAAAADRARCVPSPCSPPRTWSSSRMRLLPAASPRSALSGGCPALDQLVSPSLPALPPSWAMASTRCTSAHDLSLTCTAFRACRGKERA